MTAPELSARERDTLARIESTPAAPESFDATAAVRRVLEVAGDWEANNRHALRTGLSPSGRAVAETALQAADAIRAAVNGQPS